MDSDSHSDSQIEEIYQFKNIAVVGVSKNEEKPSHQVPKYLNEHGQYLEKLIESIRKREPKLS